MIAAVQAPPALPWLLAGPGPQAGPETLAGHVQRLGLCPVGGPDLIATIARSGLTGRGGAGFPTSRKWEAVARRGGRAVVVVNGAEGEPASGKDRVLMSMRPHLVLDGAMLAAQSVGASEVVLYVTRTSPQAVAALEDALHEREAARWQSGARPRGPSIRLVSAPPRYVAGEESAAVHLLNGGEAKPTLVPPRPFERGVGGRPTLVQNVETLALAALVARFGRAWFRSIGTERSPGPMLVTVGGAVARPGIYEVAHGAALDEVVSLSGGQAAAAPAILIGGYFGAWVPGHQAAAVRLSEEASRVGCGVVFVLPEGACGVTETARILRYLAAESTRQCGPCQHGLGALARLLGQVAAGQARPDAGDLLLRWAWQLASGRGACKHPDGAVGLLRSGMETFAADLQDHLRHRPCRGAHRSSGLPLPAHEGWR